MYVSLTIRTAKYSYFCLCGLLLLLKIPSFYPSRITVLLVFYSLIVDLPSWIPQSKPFYMLALDVFRVEAWFLLSFLAKHLLLFGWSLFTMLVLLPWPPSSMFSVPVRGCLRGHRGYGWIISLLPSPAVSAALRSHCWSLRILRWSQIQLGLPCPPHVWQIFRVKGEIPHLPSCCPMHPPSTQLGFSCTFRSTSPLSFISYSDLLLAPCPSTAWGNSDSVGLG